MFHEVLCLNVYPLYFSLYYVTQNINNVCLVDAHFSIYTVMPPLDCKLEIRN